MITYRVVRAELRRGLPLRPGEIVLSSTAKTWYILREEFASGGLNVSVAAGPFDSEQAAERQRRQMSE